MQKFEVLEICVVGLGYVGFPLAVALSKEFATVGYDINDSRVTDLARGIDTTREVHMGDLTSANQLRLTCDINEISSSNVYIVTVPTPIDQNRQPDLTPLIDASMALGQVLCPGDVVIYESTVFPGATEECCVPALEQSSGLKFNEGFFVGYSPERINPGDKVNTLETILKITSGSTPETATFVDSIYKKIISAGTFKSSSIKIAEAAKVIENTQRDLNIALINELAIIFDKLGLDTLDILEAASTKWNFQSYKPGLVGGHCISVDPYYLTHKAESVGYYPDVILSGRRINSGMGEFLADKLIRNLIVRDHNIRQSKVLILGFSFKENCPDTRNTRVVDVYRHLSSYGICLSVCDPLVEHQAVASEFNIQASAELPDDKYEAIMLCVAHDDFKSQRQEILNRLKPNGFILDLKGFFDRTDQVVRI